MFWCDGLRFLDEFFVQLWVGTVNVVCLRMFVVEKELWIVNIYNTQMEQRNFVELLQWAINLADICAIKKEKRYWGTITRESGSELWSSTTLLRSGTGFFFLFLDFVVQHQKPYDILPSQWKWFINSTRTKATLAAGQNN